MMTIDERIKEHEWLEGHTWILTSEAAETIAQQHAEEYAKAALRHAIFNSVCYALSPEEILQSFKESLKKITGGQR
jgi:hypothetical protein